jgi:glycosyltransferase involved in cell wall biosynthesis
VQQVTPAHFDAAVARGESPQRMLMLPHGFSLGATLPERDAGRAAATRRAWAAPAGRAVLLSVGMLGAERKRMDALVDAVAMMGDDRPHLVMLGHETPETPALREHAHARLGAGVWMGTWPRERMADAYEAADAFALLSLDEGFGLAYVEALAAGLPCVAHDGPVTRYVLGAQACLGDTTAPATTVALLRRALGEPAGDARRVARHQWVRAQFGWDVLAPRYAEMMRACATGHRPSWSDA